MLRPAVFTVDTFSAGQGQVTVYLDHPDGTREEVNGDGSVGAVESDEPLTDPWRLPGFVLIS